jgi:Tol biopolymer transport system component
VHGAASQPSISPDGRYVAFVERLKPIRYTLPGLRSRVWRYDRMTHATTLVSRRSGAAGGAADGYASEPSISADGTRIAFASTAGNLATRKPRGLTGIFVRDLTSATTTLVSAHGGGHAHARASAAVVHEGLLCPLSS